jgi:hypothetical protein
MKILLSVTIAVSLTALAGCGKHQEKAGPSEPHLHVNVPPHGGTLTALEDEYQIEWVLDAPTGKLQAYILDGEVENFVRIAPPSFDLRVKLPGLEEVLHFKAIANNATGETVGSTSLFEVQVDWLKTNKIFDAVLPEINVEGTVYTNVAFNFPKGDDKDEKK